jgi:hypothetical protein
VFKAFLNVKDLFLSLLFDLINRTGEYLDAMKAGKRPASIPNANINSKIMKTDLKDNSTKCNGLERIISNIGVIRGVKKKC